MFRIKYTVSILNSKWAVLKPSIKLFSIPKIDEFIYMDNVYFKVLNVVHSIDKKHGIFIVVEEFIQNSDKKIII
jgi:hypothetical protein